MCTPFLNRNIIGISILRIFSREIEIPALYRNILPCFRICNAEYIIIQQRKLQIKVHYILHSKYLQHKQNFSFSFLRHETCICRWKKVVNPWPQYYLFLITHKKYGKISADYCYHYYILWFYRKLSLNNSSALCYLSR